jgi:hypothetical protein
MSLHFKIIAVFVIMIICGYAKADAFVCIDQHGKKVFVTESCEKKGMKFGSHDFPVVSGQAINAVIIAPQSDVDFAKEKAQALKNNKKGPWDFRQGALKISPVILAFLLFSLLGIIAILSYQIYFYYKSHQQKLIFTKIDKNKDL